PGRCLAEDLGLLDRAVTGQVTGEQDHVDLARERGERLDRLLPVALATVDVAGRGDPEVFLGRGLWHDVPLPASTAAKWPCLKTWAKGNRSGVDAESNSRVETLAQ